MKLNLDCCRDVLFFLENNLTITDELEIEGVVLDDVATALNDYSIGELANTLLVLEEAGFIISNSLYSEDSIEDIIVDRITYNGYQFIESIRPETVWNKATHVLKEVGSFSIKLLSQISTSIATSLALSLL